MVFFLVGVEGAKGEFVCFFSIDLLSLGSYS